MATKKKKSPANDLNAPSASEAEGWNLTTHRILQIGDVHYPQWGDFQVDVDLKDESLPESLVSTIARDPIQTVLREISRLVHSQVYDAIALMGDITSWGRYRGFETALKVITPLIDVRQQINSGKIFIAVPGNHDVDRKRALTSTSLEDKFLPLQEALEKKGWPRFPVRGFNRYSYPLKNEKFVVYALNSCLGCGERRRLPSSIQNQVTKLIRGTGKASADKTVLEQVYEQLDTPAFDEQAIQTMVDDISRLSPSVLPIVVAHHNLLPQATPRIGLYGELINGGQFRRQLLQAGRTILYLHGHIHEDPIEVITSPAHEGGRIVSISAPQLGDGFNEIEFYSRSRKGILGCRVHRIRIRPGSGLRREKSFDIGLVPKSGIDNSLAYAVLSVMSGSRKDFFSELLPMLQRKVSGLSVEQLAATVQALYFAGTLTIENPSEPPMAWDLRL